MLSARAKCELRMAFELPPATPQMALDMLETQRKGILTTFGREGLRQSKMKAKSLKTSAASRYILHSASMRLEAQWAKEMVASLPMDSCRTLSSMAAVAVAFSSPTPIPWRTAREASRLAIDDEKACNESKIW